MEDRHKDNKNKEIEIAFRFEHPTHIANKLPVRDEFNLFFYGSLFKKNYFFIFFLLTFMF